MNARQRTTRNVCGPIANATAIGISLLSGTNYPPNHKQAKERKKMELKPCPFCGSEATLSEAMGETWVECRKCASATRMTGDGSSSADWNTRPLEASLLQRLQVVEGALTRILAHTGADLRGTYELDVIEGIAEETLNLTPTKEKDGAI